MARGFLLRRPRVSLAAGAELLEALVFVPLTFVLRAVGVTFNNFAEAIREARNAGLAKALVLPTTAAARTQNAKDAYDASFASFAADTKKETLLTRGTAVYTKLGAAGATPSASSWSRKTSRRRSRSSCRISCCNSRAAASPAR